MSFFLIVDKAYCQQNKNDYRIQLSTKIAKDDWKVNDVKVVYIKEVTYYILEKEQHKNVYSQVEMDSMVLNQLSFPFDDISLVNNPYQNLGFLTMKSGRYGLINKDKFVLLETLYDSIYSRQKSPYFIIKKDGKLDIIKIEYLPRNYDQELQFEYDNITVEEENPLGKIGYLKKDDKWGFYVLTHGKMLRIEPAFDNKPIINGFYISAIINNHRYYYYSKNFWEDDNNTKTWWEVLEMNPETTFISLDSQNKTTFPNTEYERLRRALISFPELIIPLNNGGVWILDLSKDSVFQQDNENINYRFTQINEELGPRYMMMASERIDDEFHMEKVFEIRCKYTPYGKRIMYSSIKKLGEYKLKNTQTLDFYIESVNIVVCTRLVDLKEPFTPDKKIKIIGYISQFPWEITKRPETYYSAGRAKNKDWLRIFFIGWGK